MKSWAAASRIRACVAAFRPSELAEKSIARFRSGSPEDSTGPGGSQAGPLTEPQHRSVSGGSGIGVEPGAEPRAEHAGNAGEVGDAARADEQHRGADPLG